MSRRDEDAFVEFARHSQARLRTTAYLLCGDWHRASDLVQEALIQGVRRVAAADPQRQRVR
jgi:DNA-directed RNA polymerase specialized sigma24 family protein